MHAGGGLVPRVVVFVLVQFQLNQTLRLQFHRLSPELRLDADVLPESEVLGLAVAGRDGRVVTDLLTEEYNKSLKPSSWKWEFEWDHTPAPQRSASPCPRARTRTSRRAAGWTASVRRGTSSTRTDWRWRRRWDTFAARDPPCRLLCRRVQSTRAPHTGAAKRII